MTKHNSDSQTKSSENTPVVREESQNSIDSQNKEESSLQTPSNTDQKEVENNFIDQVVITVTKQSKLQITINLLLIIAIGCALIFFVTDAGIYINPSTDTAYITSPISEENLETADTIIYMNDNFEPTLGTIDTIHPDTVTIQETNTSIDKGAIRGEPVSTINLPIDI